MDIIYKVTIEKGWYTFEQRIFKTFYFNDISIANDFIFRLSRLQRQSDCNYGKIQMEQLLNTIVKSTTRTYKQYAKLVLDMGMSGSNYSSLGRFSAMIDNIIEKNSTPVTYKKFKKDYESRIWFSDVAERNYPRSTRFIDKEQKQRILKNAKVGLELNK